MNIITTILDTLLDKAGRRLIKMRGFGFSDVRNAPEVVPFGIDGNPTDGLKAVYAETSDKGKPVVIGYLLPSQLAAKGELRLFSTDASGTLKIFLWLKADGTILLGGSDDNLVRYTPLNQALQNLVTTQLQGELVKIQTGIIAGGGTYTPATLSLDISAAKITELKTS